MGAENSVVTEPEERVLVIERVFDVTLAKRHEHAFPSRQAVRLEYDRQP